jgi:hypothetical protein
MRPIGVSILAILIILFGVLVLIVGILFLIGSAFLASIPGFGIPAGTVLLIAAVFIVFGIILIVAGLGLWNLRMWAWVLSILSLVAILVLPFLTGTYTICTLLVALVLLIYLALIRREFH